MQIASYSGSIIYVTVILAVPGTRGSGPLPEHPSQRLNYCPYDAMVAATPLNEDRGPRHQAVPGSPTYESYSPRSVGPRSSRKMVCVVLACFTTANRGSCFRGGLKS